MNPLVHPSLPLAASGFGNLRFVKQRSRRQGLTLIELLIAVALTLVIVAAMIRAFKTSSESISLGRAKMDMHTKMRVVVDQLRRDLQNATHIPNPRATADGFFELVEGEESDGEHATSQLSFIGDHDDILALTVRSEGEPFRGRFNGVWVESYLAEVIWWTQHDDTNGNGEADYDESLRLYRRVLLIRPDLNTLETSLSGFYAANDISVRPELDTNGNLVLEMNSLEDLADRRNRFARNRVQFPFEIETANLEIMTGEFEGQDLMLDNCVAFDLRVFDPTAEVFVPSREGSAIGQVVDWDDPGFGDVVSTYPPTANTYPQSGAYVNLGYDVFNSLGLGNVRWFAGNPYENNYDRPWQARTYCTWWDGYESDGLNQDNNIDIDQGVDGIDSSVGGVFDGIVDDNNERETRPPYAFPIRSLEVRIRMIEKKSNQILQQTVRENFVPN